MKLRCSQTGCQEYFHPICAYLNGVHFELVRSYRALNTTLTCAAHHPRDTLNQIYLRRFFCDYKGTSNRTDLEFEEEYRKEMQEKAASLADKLKELRRGVKRSGKISKSFKCSQQRPARTIKDRIDVVKSISKRDSS
jgi:hypothetical protein